MVGVKDIELNKVKGGVMYGKGDYIEELQEQVKKLQADNKVLVEALELFMKFADDESMQDINPVYENAQEALNKLKG